MFDADNKTRQCITTLYCILPCLSATKVPAEPSTALRQVVLFVCCLQGLHEQAERQEVLANKECAEDLIEVWN